MTVSAKTSHILYLRIYMRDCLYNASSFLPVETIKSEDSRLGPWLRQNFPRKYQRPMHVHIYVSMCLQAVPALISSTALIRASHALRDKCSFRFSLLLRINRWFLTSNLWSSRHASRLLRRRFGFSLLFRINWRFLTSNLWSSRHAYR